MLDALEDQALVIMSRIFFAIERRYSNVVLRASGARACTIEVRGGSSLRIARRKSPPEAGRRQKDNHGAN